MTRYGTPAAADDLLLPPLRTENRSRRTLYLLFSPLQSFTPRENSSSQQDLFKNIYIYTQTRTTTQRRRRRQAVSEETLSSLTFPSPPLSLSLSLNWFERTANKFRVGLDATLCDAFSCLPKSLFPFLFYCVTILQHTRGDERRRVTLCAVCLSFYLPNERRGKKKRQKQNNSTSPIN